MARNSGGDKPLSVEVGMLTDPGCRRERNEDSIALVSSAKYRSSDKGMLAIVADGMGGHRAGDRASRLAVETISLRYYETMKSNPLASLSQAFMEANERIYQEALTHPECRGMGTTATAMALRGDAIYFAHVGDSRLYRVRGEGIELLTEDHTLVMALKRSGALTEDQVRDFPDLHVITRALGSHPQVDVMTSGGRLQVHARDRYVLCSDGLHDLVRMDEIKESLKERTPQQACDFLVDLAKKRGGHDNVSLIVIKVSEGKRVSVAPVTQVEEVAAHA